MIPLRVLGDRVLVQPDVLSNAPVQTDSGVVIATSMAAAVTGEDAVQSVTRGTVIAVGNPTHPHAERVKMIADAVRTELRGPSISECEEASELLHSLVRREPCCAVGDDVLFAYDAGQQITLEGESYILLHETDLLAVVEPEQELTHG